MPINKMDMGVHKDVLIVDMTGTGNDDIFLIDAYWPTSACGALCVAGIPESDSDAENAVLDINKQMGCEGTDSMSKMDIMIQFDRLYAVDFWIHMLEKVKAGMIARGGV